MPENKRRRLVLHIGDPKTGTTSIQQALRLGLVESEAGSVSGFLTDAHSANAVTLARSFTREGKDKRKASMLGVRLWLRENKANYSIISSEFFSKANPTVVNNVFLRHFPKLSEDMQVIGYARPYLGRTLSAYTEEIRNGYTTLDFDTWITRNIKKCRLMCFPRFQLWRDVFAERLTVRPFVRSKLTQGDAVKDFFGVVFDHQPFSVQSAPEENQAISLKALAGLQAFNRQIAAAKILPKRRIPLSRTIHYGLTPGATLEKPRLDRDTIDMIIAAHREDAHQMDEGFFKEPIFTEELGKDFSGSPKSKINLALDAYFSPQEQSEIASHTQAIINIPAAQIEKWHRHYSHNRMLRNLGKLPNQDGGGMVQEHLDALSTIFS